MKHTKLNISLILGLVAIVGILIAQLLWTRQAYGLEEKKFTQKAHIALLEVAKKLYEGTNHELPSDNPVQKVSNDYYIVNVNNDFEPEILEYFLRTEFEKINLNTDFEYAMYDCQSDEMVYGNYVSADDKVRKARSIYFPKHKNLVYYFAIRFPNESTYLLGSLKFWFFLSFALIVILVVYVYSIVTIVQQRKYSELQRDFINNMTHEFKTPLSSILIASQYLSGHESLARDEKLRRYAEIIITQGGKLNSHIEKILDVARSDASPMQLEKVDVPLLPVLQEAADTILLKHPKAVVDIRIPEGETILADPFHFSNLAYNLIDNSIKYGNSEPVITISLNIGKDRKSLIFSDNGPGVPQNRIPFIFDKFYRISQTSRQVTGFGLGLYYVRKICKLHGWDISAKNLADGFAISIRIS